MTNENFFKHNDKAYAENLNDAILIANAFDYEVPVNLPAMYNNNHYPSNNNTYKVGVADVTIITSGSLSIGDTAITNNSNTSQILRLRIYPNFNSFYSWKDISWTATGAITIDICDAGTTTSLLPAGELTNSDGNRLNGIASLQGLKEYDLLIKIPVNGVLNTLSIVFVNNWNSSNRVSASLSTSNVTGLDDQLTSLSNVTEELSASVVDLEEDSDWVACTTLSAIENSSLYERKKGGIAYVNGFVTPRNATQNPRLAKLSYKPTKLIYFQIRVYNYSTEAILRDVYGYIDPDGYMGINSNSIGVLNSPIYIDVSYPV